MRSKAQPIKPSQIIAKKKDTIPEEVFEVFNELITEHFSNGSSTFKLKDVVKLLVKKGLKENVIFDKGWLDVEEIYEKAGWDVSYDKPAYNESYDATFTFTCD